jgi:hypothetical protein
VAEWPRASNNRVTVPPMKPAPPGTRIFIKSLSQAFLLDTINDPVSIHTVTAVYLATELSLHALERVGDSIRETRSRTLYCDWPKTSLFEQMQRSA